MQVCYLCALLHTRRALVKINFQFSKHLELVAAVTAVLQDLTHSRWIFLATALCDHNQTVFEEMTSWTALTWHIGMTIVFKTEHMKGKYFWTYYEDFKLHEWCISKEKQHSTSYVKNSYILVLMLFLMLVCILV